MRVKDIMSKKFASLQADDSIDRVLEVFSAKGISSAPVFDKDDFIGIITLADIARTFAPRGPVPFFGGDGSQEVNVSKLAKKPPFVLTPDQPVSLVLQKLVNTDCCIPVVSDQKVIGLVWKGDVVEFFLSERAKEDIEEKAEESAGLPRKAAQEIGDSTAIDKVLEIVHRKGETTSKEVAAELGITPKTAEDLAKLLDKHRLVRVNYSFLSGLVIRRMEHGD
jgi:predicted transcriptional regulator